MFILLGLHSHSPGLMYHYTYAKLFLSSISCPFLFSIYLFSCLICLSSMANTADEPLKWALAAWVCASQGQKQRDPPTIWTYESTRSSVCLMAIRLLAASHCFYTELSVHAACTCVMKLSQAHYLPRTPALLTIACLLFLFRWIFCGKPLRIMWVGDVDAVIWSNRIIPIA